MLLDGCSVLKPLKFLLSVPLKKLQGSCMVLASHILLQCIAALILVSSRTRS